MIIPGVAILYRKTLPDRVLTDQRYRHHVELYGILGVKVDGIFDPLRHVMHVTHALFDPPDLRFILRSGVRRVSNYGDHHRKCHEECSKAPDVSERHGHLP
jgi:hypothetical protein